ncbi:MAG TPA: PRC-barrel domain-containing protein [Verrucomicrobiae bacterium]
MNSLVVSTLCVAAAGWMTAQAQAQAQDQPIGGINQSEQRTESTMSAPGQPQKLNKCSELIGSRVENDQGDKLGKVEEVVVDLNNGKVSYCVMSVEHSLFSTPKYLAVPLAAFKPSQDGSHLILNADKNKVAQAQGFDRNNWPSVSNPVWGAQPFWETTPKANITPSTPSTPSTRSDEDKTPPPSSSH